MFLGMLILIALCSICTVFFVPTTFFNLGAGFLYNIWWGTLATTIGISIGTTLGFLWGRTLARSWVERIVAKRPKLRAVDRAVEARGLLLVILLRLSPVFPLPLLSYVLGATKVSFISFVLGTAVGALPGIFLYCIIGHNMTALTNDFSQGLKDPMFWIGLVVSVVAIILVSLITRYTVVRITRKFEQEEEENVVAAKESPEFKTPDDDNDNQHIGIQISDETEEGQSLLSNSVAVQ